jgi:hypothetical protein
VSRGAQRSGALAAGAVVGAVALVVALTGLSGHGCAAPSAPAPTPASGPAPATSAELVTARAARAARKRALAEQEPYKMAAAEGMKEEEPVEAPPIASEAPAASASVAPVASAAPTASASASAAPEAPKPPSVAELCERLCERGIECAIEMLDRQSRGYGEGSVLDAFKKRIRERKGECLEECRSRAAKEKDKIDAAQKCMDEKDCKDFMECLEELLRDED